LLNFLRSNLFVVPSAPSSPALVHVTSSSISLIWYTYTIGIAVTTRNRYYNVLWRPPSLSGQRFTSASTSSSATISNLQSNQAYTFSVIASNNAGTSEKSNATTLMTGMFCVFSRMIFNAKF